MDLDLDIEDTELSPGVGRMIAVVAHEAAFDEGRAAEAARRSDGQPQGSRADIEQQQQQELRRALQLELAIPIGTPIPLYVEMDGTGIPVVRKESEGRKGKRDGQPAHTREAKLGCVFTQTTVDAEGYPIRDEASTTYVFGPVPYKSFVKSSPLPPF